jgi:hypothetical protein
MPIPKEYIETFCKLQNLVYCEYYRYLDCKKTCNYAIEKNMKLRYGKDWKQIAWGEMR